MRKFCWVIAAFLFMAIGAPRAHADEIFNISGTATNTSGGTLGTCAADATCAFSGTLTIDTTSGTITAVDITFPGLSDFTTIGFDYSIGGTSWFASLGNSTSGTQLNFSFSTSPTGGSLVGFTGGTLESGSIFNFIVGPLYTIVDGTITPSTAVPEPGTLSLLLFGLAGLLLVRKRMARDLPMERQGLG